jgi:hypothetical protein
VFEYSTKAMTGRKGGNAVGQTGTTWQEHQARGCQDSQARRKISKTR